MSRKLISRIGQRINRWRAARLVEPSDATWVWLGTKYGGWQVPKNLLSAGGVAICAGAGEDISFDVELNRRGLTVYTVDPTPRASVHVHDMLAMAAAGTAMPINNRPDELYNFDGFDPSRFHFMQVGLWNKNEVMRFFAPPNDAHVSHSVRAEGMGEKYFDAECITISELLKRTNRPSVSVLKLDIERAELVVIENILEGNFRPECLLIEYDEGHSPIDGGYYDRIRASISSLQRAGYRLACVDVWNFVFVYRPLPTD